VRLVQTAGGDGELGDLVERQRVAVRGALAAAVRPATRTEAWLYGPIRSTVPAMARRPR